MTKYRVIFGYYSELVTVDEPTTDYGAILDFAIDQLESGGNMGVFVSNDDIEAIADNGKIR